MEALLIQVLGSLSGTMMLLYLLHFLILDFPLSFVFFSRKARECQHLNQKSNSNVNRELTEDVNEENRQ